MVIRLMLVTVIIVSESCMHMRMHATVKKFNGDVQLLPQC